MPIGVMPFWRGPVATDRSMNRRHTALLSLGIFVAFCTAYLFRTDGLLQSYPKAWSWTELFLNYQGGFNKRGLLGEVAYDLHGIVRPQRLVAVLLLFAYGMTAALAVFGLKLARGFEGLLILMSPAGFLFPLLNPAAFGRKDAFVLLSVTAGVSLARGPWDRSASLIAAVVLFSTSALIVEISWLYFPPVLTAFILGSERKTGPWMVVAYIGSGVLALLWLASTLLISPADVSAISASWQSIGFANVTDGALCCLNFGIRSALDVAKEPLVSPFGYIVAVLLGVVPIVCLLARGPLRHLTSSQKAAVATACLIPAFPIFVTADWGRYIYLWLTTVFLALWAMGDRQVLFQGPALSKRDVLIRSTFLFLYASTWQVAHHQPVGKTTLLPGVLFRLLGPVTPAPNPY